MHRYTHNIVADNKETHFCYDIQTDVNMYSMCITQRSSTPDLWSHTNVHMHAIIVTYSHKDITLELLCTGTYL